MPALPGRQGSFVPGPSGKVRQTVSHLGERVRPPDCQAAGRRPDVQDEGQRHGHGARGDDTLLERDGRPCAVGVHLDHVPADEAAVADNDLDPATLGETGKAASAPIDGHVLPATQLRHAAQAPFSGTLAANSAAQRRKSAQPAKICESFPSQPDFLCHYRCTHAASTRTNRSSEQPFRPERQATFEAIAKEPEMSFHERPRPDTRQDGPFIPFRFTPA